MHRLNQTTPTPNTLFDRHLPTLSGSELKVLLVVIRQTYGWKDNKGGRKKRDRISNGYFQNKTGLSKKAISKAIDMLVKKGLLLSMTRQGQVLNTAALRQGKRCVFYACCLQQGYFVPITSEKSTPLPITKGNITKETRVKETLTKQGVNSKTANQRNTGRLTDRQRYEQILAKRLADKGKI